MKIKKSEIESILDSIDDLIELKVLIRKIAPNYKINEKVYQKFLSKLKTLKKNLDPLFSHYLNAENLNKREEFIKNQKEKIKKALSKDNIAIISSNSAKKILKNMGIDPRKLIITGGPLFFEDYKEVNPQIPDSALKGIKKKCNNLIQEIKNRNWNKNKNLYFLYEKGDLSDELTLKKLDRISDLINQKVKIIEINSWKDLES